MATVSLLETSGETPMNDANWHRGRIAADPCHTTSACGAARAVRLMDANARQRSSRFNKTSLVRYSIDKAL